jgi:hypothetical protein
MLDFTSPHTLLAMRKKLRTVAPGRKAASRVMPGWELAVMEIQEEKLDFTRRSPKCAISGRQPDCLLTIGSQRLAATLGDEWDNGMSVTIQGTPSFWVEDTGVLKSADVETEVRVSNIVRLEAEAEEDEPNSTPPTFRIGLVRLSQIAVKLRPESSPPAAETPQAKPLTYLRKKPFRLPKGTILAVGLSAIALAILAIGWHYGAGVIGGIVSQKGHATNSDGESDDRVTAESATKSDIPRVAREISRLPGVEPFLNPEVANLLELTASQMSALERLDKTTQGALQDLEQYWGGGSRLELTGRQDMLLNAARHEGLRLLTRKQRQQWEAISR